MKSLQKFILPALFIIAAFLIYTIYFSPKEGLGSFSDFDPNNNANKDIRVTIADDQGIKKDQQSGASVFYAKDKNGTIVMVQGPLMLPPGIEDAATVILRGHLHKEYFHAAEVIVD